MSGDGTTTRAPEDLQEGSVGLTEASVWVVATHAAMAGLCPLIPVPFVDDLIIRRIRRRMYRELSACAGFRLAEPDARFLAARPSNFLRGAIKSLIWWPVKKVVRKVVYVLAIKACADVAADVFHEGWLFARAMERAYVPPDALARGEQRILHRLREAIITVNEDVGPSGSRQVMASAFGVGRAVLGPLLRSLAIHLSARDEAGLDAAEEELTPITLRVRDELRAHWRVAPQLDASLREQLG